MRNVVAKRLGAHHKVWLPEFTSETSRSHAAPSKGYRVRERERATGKVAVCAT